jgi:hypothetical protein
MLHVDRLPVREGTKMTTSDNQASPAEAPDLGPEDRKRAEREQDLQHIREALRGLRYGTVNIIIQDGVVVQIDRTEKKRVRRSGS